MNIISMEKAIARHAFKNFAFANNDPRMGNRAKEMETQGYFREEFDKMLRKSEKTGKWYLRVKKGD